jgi:OmpA-OmpF porin, OOP family
MRSKRKTNKAEGDRMIKNKLLLSAAAAAAIAASGGVVHAQATGGYWQSPGANQAWKNSAGQCWRSGAWTPALATTECDPDLVPKPKPVAAPTPPPAPAPAPVAPAPAPKPAPVAPVAKPEPPKPAVVTLKATELFAFNSAALTDRSRATLDREVVSKVRDMREVRFINVYGHTDRLGSAQYNQRLSERRAEAVKGYLVSRGIDANKIETYGYGQTLPVKACPDIKSRKELIECLAPNRRVDVEIQGL